MVTWHDGFPSPVHESEAVVYVHRDIAIEHEASADCPCGPLALDEQDFNDPRRDIQAELNARGRLN